MRIDARAAAAAAGWIALVALAMPVAAQHEHHGTPTGSAQVLEAVTTNARRDAIELGSGVTTVDTRASLAAGGSIADLLRTVPGVEVDAEGRISMRGSTSVQVLLDGRPVSLADEALAAYLRRMPAAALERIEVATTASARHDADGHAGIVNLVSRRDRAPRSGMRSLAGSIAGDDHYMASAAAAGDARDRVTWDAMYSLSGMRPRAHSETTRWSVEPGTAGRHVDSRARAAHRLHSIIVGTSATPGSGVALALRGTWSWMEGTYRTSTAFADLEPAGPRSTNAVSSLLAHAIPSAALSAAARVDRWGIRFASEARTSVVDEQFRGDDAQGTYRFLTMTMHARQREHVVQHDAQVQLDAIRLEVGQQSRFHSVVANRDAAYGGVALSNAFRRDADVHAGYVTVQRAAGAAHAEVGLRVEVDRTRMQLETVTTRRAVRLFPSIRARWSDARHDLLYRVAYGRGIDRPGAAMLNPYGMGEHDLNDVVGNPALLPEVSDQIEAGIERAGSRLTLQLTPFHRWTRDPIRALKVISGTGHATTALENLARARSTGADGSVRVRLTEGTNVTLAGTVAHMQTTAELLGSSGVHATARLTVDARVSGSTTAHLYAYRRTAQAIEQGEILPAFTSQLALTHRVAGERGRVTLRFNDPLRSDHIGSRIAAATFTQESRRRTAQPLVSLFASYAVGGRPREDAPVRAEGPVRIF